MIGSCAMLSSAAVTGIALVVFVFIIASIILLYKCCRATELDKDVESGGESSE